MTTAYSIQVTIVYFIKVTTAYFIKVTTAFFFFIVHITSNASFFVIITYYYVIY